MTAIRERGVGSPLGELAAVKSDSLMDRLLISVRQSRDPHRERPRHVECDLAWDIVILHDHHNQPFLNPARRSPVTM
jgi:hypothetical protein